MHSEVSMTASWKHRFIAASKILILVIVLLAITGVVYEQIGKRQDRRKYPQIGQFVDIGGRKLNIFCSGNGSPTVVFDSGGHTAGYSWIDIQPEVAKVTRACWYDRAGYGWSDPGPSPRTFKAIATDLHDLLHAADIAPPYVLVSATAAGFHVRLYNHLYPDEVAGALLVHPSDPDVLAHEPAYMKSALASSPPIVQKVGCKVLLPVMLHTGLLRLMGNPGSGWPYGIANLNPDQQKELKFLSTNPETAQTEGEGCVQDESMAEVRAAGNFGTRPLIILTSSKPFRAPPGGQHVRAADEANDYWFHQMLPDLAGLSTRGELVVEENAEQPDSIIRAVNRVVAEVRAEQAQATIR
jgi:pimeloyl-ACP methyl ester carboxylesterase